MVGMIICMVVGVFYLPWAAVMSRVMLRKEHSSPVLSSISLLGGGPMPLSLFLIMLRF